MLKEPTSSGGTVPRSAADVNGNNTFFAPLSRHTCNVFANSSTFINVPPILTSPNTAKLEITGFPKATEHMAIIVGNVN